MAVSTVAVAPQVRLRTRFYFRMAVLMGALGLVGFVPTFWQPMSRGFYTSPVITIHALACSAWLVLFLFQSWLAASGRLARHRDVGLAGVSLATTVVIFGIMAGINQTQRAAAAGNLEAGLRFMVLPLWQALLLAAMFAAAFSTIRRPEWHKRLLLFATGAMMDAPLNRLFVYFVVFHGRMPVPAGMPSPPPPVDAGHPVGLLADAVLFGLPMMHDWRTRHRVHPAYIVAYVAIVSMRLLRPLVSRTATWHSIAVWVLSLAG
jgi:hypothetical protein